MSEWFIRHRTALLVSVLVCVLAAGGVLLAQNRKNAPMQLTQEAIDISNNVVHEETVDYYTKVCPVALGVQNLPLDYIRTSTDVLGEDAYTTATTNKKSLETSRDKARGYARDIAVLDQQAPVVMRADGKEYDYAQALVPMTLSLQQADKKLGTLVADQRWTSDDVTVVQEIVSDTAREIADMSADSLDTLSQLGDKAPILSEATRDRILSVPACKILLGNEFNGDGQDVVVQPLVDMVGAVIDTHSKLQHKTEVLDRLGELEAVDPTVVRDKIAEVWSEVADIAGDAQKQYELFDKTYDTSTREGRATVQAVNKVKADVPAPRAVANNVETAARAYSELINNTDVNALSDVVNNSQEAADIRTAQIEHAKLATLVNATISMPTKATADVISQRRKDWDEKNKLSAQQQQAIDAHKKVAARITNLSDVSNSVTNQGVAVTVAAPQLADALDGIAEAARNAARDVADDKEGVKQFNALAIWAGDSAVTMRAAYTSQQVSAALAGIEETRRGESTWIVNVVDV